MRDFLKVSRFGLAVALLASARLATAQLPNASPAAFAMGGNYTAIARGYEAVAWNPANLAMPGRPFISLGLGIFGGSIGMDPIDFNTLNAYSGVKVDSAVRASWLDQVKLSGSQKGRFDGAITPIALSVGPIGLQAGVTTYLNADLSPDAFESLVLFGNAGNNGGAAKTLDFAGTSLRAGATSTGALSFALPIPINLTNGMLPGERAAIAVTGKFITGHALLIAQDVGSSFGTSDTMLVRFPVIAPDSNYEGSLGTGTGADVALSWSAGPWRVGVLAENVFNTFKWDTTKLAFMPGTGTIAAGEDSETDFDQVAYGQAPAALREIVAAQVYKPAIAAGIAFAMTNSLTVTADMKMHTGGEETIIVGPKSHVGVGAEWRLLPFLPLRAGVASVTDGWQAGAGLGLRLFGYELGVSTSIRRRGTANQSGLMIGLVGIGH